MVSRMQPQHPLDARNAGVSMIYQELSLARHLTVMENIVLGMEPTAGPFVKWKEFSLRADEAMKQLGRSDIRPDTPVQKLSIASAAACGNRPGHRRGSTRARAR